MYAINPKNYTKYINYIMEKNNNNIGKNFKNKF